jgi:hypothetical protein
LVLVERVFTIAALPRRRVDAMITRLELCAFAQGATVKFHGWPMDVDATRPYIIGVVNTRAAPPSGSRGSSSPTPMPQAEGRRV